MDSEGTPPTPYLVVMRYAKIIAEHFLLL
jgi:hypothetical protein